MTNESKDFAYHYYLVMTDAMHSSRLIQDKANRIKEIQSFNHPALYELKELLDKYCNFAKHAYFFFAKAIEVALNKKINDDVDGLIALSLAHTEALIAEKMAHLPDQKKHKEITPQETQKRAFAAYKKLLGIHRDIIESSQLAEMAVTSRMEKAHSVSIYIAVENYAASKGLQIIPAEQIFPEIKHSIIETKRMRMTRVVELQFVAGLPKDLQDVRDVIQSMNSVFTEASNFAAPTAFVNRISAGQNMKSNMEIA